MLLTSICVPLICPCLAFTPQGTSGTVLFLPSSSLDPGFLVLWQQVSGSCVVAGPCSPSQSRGVSGPAGASSLPAPAWDLAENPTVNKCVPAVGRRLPTSVFKMSLCFRFHGFIRTCQVCSAAWDSSAVASMMGLIFGLEDSQLCLPMPLAPGPRFPSGAPAVQSVSVPVPGATPGSLLRLGVVH